MIGLNLCESSNVNIKFIFLLILLVANAYCGINEKCVTSDKKAGICKLDSECFALKSKNITNHERAKFLRNRCDFEGGSVILCCPIEINSRLSVGNSEPIEEPSKTQNLGQVGSKCLIFNNTPGICKLENECFQNLTTEVQKQLAYPTNRCGFSGTSPIVCCINKNVDSECLIYNHKIGTCKLKNECLSNLPSNVHNELVYPANRCGFRGNTPIICCPRIKSQEACKNFGKRPPAVSLRITGGTRALENEFPYFAALGYRNNENYTISFGCGGALISESFVLTAAHCIKSSQPSLVRLGMTSISSTEDNDEPGAAHISIDVKQRIRHPNYRKPIKYNDIALIELMRSVTFENNIFPACISLLDFEPGTTLKIAGFGVDDLKKGSQPSWMLKAEVEAISNHECNETYSRANQDFKSLKIPQGIKATMMCAKSKSSLTADTCKGDSGTGVYMKSLTANQTLVVAITSFGLGCGSTVPSIYSRVSEYNTWIERYVWP